jgi:hypothetical protein
MEKARHLLALTVDGEGTTGASGATTDLAVMTHLIKAELQHLSIAQPTHGLAEYQHLPLVAKPRLQQRRGQESA